MSYKLDDALLKGDGLLNTVTGILNQVGVQPATLDASLDCFLDALALAAAEVTHTVGSSTGLTSTCCGRSRTLTEKYILESDITAGTTYRLFAIPVTVTNKLPLGKAILADMS